MDNNLERFQLVVPKDVLDRARKLATSERRSVSNMIVVLMEEALKARDKESKSGNSLPLGIDVTIPAYT